MLLFYITVITRQILLIITNNFSGKYFCQIPGMHCNI